MEKIYYYKTANGMWHFSTGITRDDSRASQYLRMLRYSGRKVEPLYLDNPNDFQLICREFGIDPATPWQQIYNR